MSVVVELPAAYRRHAEDRREVLLEEGRLQDVLAALCSRFAGLRGRLVSQDGRPYGSVAMFVNGVDARAIQGLDTPLGTGDVLTLVPAISGG